MSSTKATVRNVRCDAGDVVVKDVSVRFDAARGRGAGLTAVEDVSFTIPNGGLTAIVGPSGCGKSTLLRVLAGLISDFSGSVSVFGGSSREARLSRKLGFVFQEPALLPWRTALDNVRLALEVGASHIDRGRLRDPSDVLDLVNLRDFADAYPSELSGGMRQRVAIARALVTSPQLLLMDEPFGAVDEITRDRLNVELLAIWQKTQTTIAFVTHSLPEAAFLAQDVLVLTPRPARVRGVIQISLPYPRSIDQKESPECVAAVASIRRRLDGLT